jgi:enoyl-CoA hydratase/carnithine racemase
VAAILRVIHRSGDLPLLEALDYELDEFSPLAGTPDSIEGVRARFEKRKPVSTGE